MIDFSKKLTNLIANEQFRQCRDLQHDGKYIIENNKKMLNLASNDYLGLASNTSLRTQFFQKYNDLPLSSSSSRLLSGNFPIHQQLEQLMANRFKREACLLFNSGYHANIGIIPAIADKDTLIIADKWVHASIIDGIRLSAAKHLRYPHQDYARLAYLLEQHAHQFKRVLVITESIFSMDGDATNLRELVRLKQKYAHVLLYIDEAHAIGLLGSQGLGLSEELNCIQEIDFIVGAMGKALSSMGAYVICDTVMRDFLVNHARSVIFSTNLPPINVAWTYFIFEQLPTFSAQRRHLQRISQKLHRFLLSQNGTLPEVNSCIIPYILGDNALCVQKAERLQQQGFFCLPIRPPTVPLGTARIRFSLRADLEEQEIDHLIHILAVS